MRFYTGSGPPESKNPTSNLALLICGPRQGERGLEIEVTNDGV
jgi:hypothetical protein